MNLSDHLSNEGLEQLTNNLRYLNLVQIKIIRLRVQWAVIKMRAKRTALAVYYGLPNLIRKMQIKAYPAHWVVSSKNGFMIYVSDRVRVAFSVLFFMLFFELLQTVIRH